MYTRSHTFSTHNPSHNLGTDILVCFPRIQDWHLGGANERSMCIPQIMLLSDISTMELSSVATAKADVFRKNAISVENKFAKIMKIFDKINEVKSRRVI
jgi:hypothetical protein